MRFVITAVLTGLLFGILDGLINANPLAVKLMSCFKPIAREKINVLAGIIIDLCYGFAISGLFLFLKDILSGHTGLMKGIVYGAGIWFFRGLMNAVSSWMMYHVPGRTLLYMLLTGLAEMMALGILNGIIIPS